MDDWACATAIWGEGEEVWSNKSLTHLVCCHVRIYIWPHKLDHLFLRHILLKIEEGRRLFCCFGWGKNFRPLVLTCRVKVHLKYHLRNSYLLATITTTMYYIKALTFICSFDSIIMSLSLALASSTNGYLQNMTAGACPSSVCMQRIRTVLYICSNSQKQ